MKQQIIYILKDMVVSYRYNHTLRLLLLTAGIVWFACGFILIFSYPISSYDWTIAITIFVLGICTTAWNFYAYMKIPDGGPGEKTAFRKLRQPHYLHKNQAHDKYRIREVMVGDTIKWVVEYETYITKEKPKKVFARDLFMTPADFRDILKRDNCKAEEPSEKVLAWRSVQPIDARKNKPFHNIYSPNLDSYVYAEYVYLWYVTATVQNESDEPKIVKSTKIEQVDDWSDY